VLNGLHEDQTIVVYLTDLGGDAGRTSPNGSRYSWARAFSSIYVDPAQPFTNRLQSKSDYDIANTILHELIHYYTGAQDTFPLGAYDPTVTNIADALLPPITNSVTQPPALPPAGLNLQWASDGNGNWSIINAK